MQTTVKKSETAFYSSPFSGILPCEIVRTGRKKIFIHILGYDTHIWVAPAKLLLPERSR